MALLQPQFTDDLVYPFSSLRMLASSLTSAGVVHSGGDMLVSPSSGLQVQIAAGQAYVQQTVEPEDAFLSGLYQCLNDAPANPYNTILAPNVNPRVDQVILRVYDVREQGLGGSSKAQFEWLQGTETAGAQINNPAGAGYLAGAAPLPDNTLRLAYVIQTVGESSIPSADIDNVASVASRPSSGWISLGAGTGWTSSAFARQVGDRIELKGYATTTTSTPSITMLTGLPQVSVGRVVGADHATGGPVHSYIALNPSFTTIGVYTGGVTFASGDVVNLDGVSYPA